MELCAGAARGSYLVCIGWTTLIVSKDVAIVGQVFVTAMLTTILSGFFIGVIVDRHNRKYLTIFSHLGIAITLLLLGFGVALTDGIQDYWFFVAVVAVTVFRNIYQSSHDGLIHANVNNEELVHSIARFRGIHLLMTAIGTVLTGIVIEVYSPTAGFILCSSFSLLLILSVIFVKGVRTKENIVGLSGMLNDLSVGLSLFRDNRVLWTLTLLAGVSLPIGQLSNAILSSFIHDDLGRGSDVFGLVDAAWPVGGMVAAAILSLGLKQLSVNKMEYAISLIVGLVTVLFSFCTTVFALTIAHALMGFSVWLCRIIIDSRMLQLCSESTVGRTKVFIEIMFGLFAMIMCLSPTIIKLPYTSGYFLYWGVIVVIGTGILWLSRSIASRQAIDSDQSEKST